MIQYTQEVVNLLPPSGSTMTTYHDLPPSIVVKDHWWIPKTITIAETGAKVYQPLTLIDYTVLSAGMRDN